MKWIMAVAGAATLAGCQTAEDSAEREARLQAEIAARQGAEVNRVCFTRNINGWRPLGDDAILVRARIDDWYQLNLSGTCDPEWAFNAIVLESRPAGGSCVSRGDHITTPETPISGRCVITSIHEWDEEAEMPEARSY